MPNDLETRAYPYRKTAHDIIGVMESGGAAVVVDRMLAVRLLAVALLSVEEITREVDSE